MEIDDVYSCYCEQRFPLPTESEIAALEKRIKSKLPDDYREFIKNYNGGFFAGPWIVYSSPISVQWRGRTVKHDYAVLQGLHGLHATLELFELGRSSDLSLFDGNDPLQLLVIGHADPGLLLLMDFLPENFGEILAKFPDEYAYRIAGSIDELFSLVEGPRE